MPFEVNLAKDISNGTKEGKVVTRDGGNARIICWDAEGDQPIIALIKYHDKEYPHSFCMNGLLEDGDYLNGDLMLEIPEYTTFKDGDVLYAETKDGNRFTFIKKNSELKTYKYVSLNNGQRLSFVHAACCYDGYLKILRFASESKKQRLVEALKETKETADAKECLKILGAEVKPECEFKPFDRVLVRDGNDGCWHADIFSYKNKDRGRYYCTGYEWRQCIPYNDQTKHLLGTTHNWEGEYENQNSQKDNGVQS